MMLENVDGLLEAWFADQVKATYVPCIHCIKHKLHPPFQFLLSDCELAVTRGQQFVICREQVAVRIGKQHTLC